MALHENILENLEGFSLAKYSTWFFYRPDRILLDCGEGVSTTLGNRIYGIERVLLSHGHGDHVAGIPGFLYSRASSMGDTTKPLEIYYPKGDPQIEKLRRYVAQILPRPPFPLDWRELVPGNSIPLPSPNRSVVAFPTEHLVRGLSLGYTIEETRNQLKPEFTGRPQAEIVKIVRESGKAAITQTYAKKLLVYSGDSRPLPAEVAKETEVLLHEATFLAADDIDREVHSTVAQALATAKAADVRSIVLFHLSTRYHRSEAKEAIRRAVAELGLQIPVLYTFPRGLPTRFVRLDAAEGDPP